MIFVHNHAYCVRRKTFVQPVHISARALLDIFFTNLHGWFGYPSGEGREHFTCSNDFYLPSRRLDGGGGQHPVVYCRYRLNCKNGMASADELSILSLVYGPNQKESDWLDCFYVLFCTEKLTIILFPPNLLLDAALKSSGKA